MKYPLLFVLLICLIAFCVSCRKKCKDELCDDFEGKWVWQKTYCDFTTSRPSSEFTIDSCQCSCDIEFFKNGKYLLNQADFVDDTLGSSEVKSRYYFDAETRTITLRGEMHGPVIGYHTNKHEFKFETVDPDTLILSRDCSFYFVRE